MIPVILAGGSGTRFWPLSRKARPKQLLELWGDQSMIEEALDRGRAVAGADQEPLVVLGEHLVEVTKTAVEGLGDDQLIVEPCPRNTAPAIALAAAYVAERHGADEPMAIFPSDHYIGGLDAFGDCIRLAGDLAQGGQIVTLGITPTHPETGYGYIHFTDETQSTDESGISAHRVAAFVEKPTREIAQRYVDSGDYAWNSGMFVMTPKVLFAEMRRQIPEMADAFERIRRSIGTDDERQTVGEAFNDLRGISIDYGIMEGAEDVVVIPATFRWSDVGHWAAVDQVREVDASNNVVEGDALVIDSAGCVVYAENSDRLVACVGLDDMVVVDTPDALLVVPKRRAQDVRQVVAALEKAGRQDLL